MCSITGAEIPVIRREREIIRIPEPPGDEPQPVRGGGRGTGEHRNPEAPDSPESSGRSGKRDQQLFELHAFREAAAAFQAGIDVQQFAVEALRPLAADTAEIAIGGVHI